MFGGQSKSKNTVDLIPIYSPRSTYNQIKINDQKMISDMTLNFDKITIGILKKSFEQKNGKLNLQQFIILAKQHLNFWQPDLPNRDMVLIRYLTQLFAQIDINGNDQMEWKQLTNYIIQKAIVLKNLKSKSQQIKRYVKSDKQPKLKIDGIIQKAQYIKDIDKMAFFYQGASKIYFMDLKDGTLLDKILEIDPKKIIINICSIKKKKAGKVQIKKKDLQIPTEVRVLDILYLNDKKYKSLLVATSDGYVRGWKHTQTGFSLATQPDNQQQIFQHYFNSQIYCMSWDSVNEVLYCGQKSGNIYMWNLKTDLQKPLYEANNVQVQKKQNNSEQKINCMITTMITMPKLQFMASGRMDGKLILWDTINNKKKWVYRQHTRGVLSLAFNQNMILLFSAGFDHKICVWNPYISTLIHKIQTHLSPILSLRVIESSNQLISLDSDGVVKITDTKRFHNIYSFLIQRQQTNQIVANGSNGYNLSSFIAIDRPLKLIFLGKSLSIYEYDKNYNPHTADQNIVVSCQYIQDLLCFATASGNKIKLWSALNGDINKIFIEISQYQITAIGLDSLKKKIIIGDIMGNLSVHNVLNGAKIKQLAKHNTQIFSIVTMRKEVQMFISCSIDNQIRIFKENNDNYQIVRYIYFRKDIQITYLKYQNHINLMMIGTNVGKIGFYDAQTGKNIGNFQNNVLEQITSINQTNQSVVIATAASGKIIVFGIPPVSSKFQKIISYNHLDSQKQDNSSLGITASCYNQQKNFLYVMDDKNYLTCYDLSQIKLYKIGVKQANNQSQGLMGLNKKWQKLKFRILWQVKTNQQLVKTIQFVTQQNLICTSSFDKKVKIWNALTGQFIDSLQQNYNKISSEPIAYYDYKNSLLFSKNKQQIIDNLKIDINKLQYQSRQLSDILQNYQQLKNLKSSTQWNLKVDINSEQRNLKIKLEDVKEKLQFQENKNQKSRITLKRSQKSNKKITINKTIQQMSFNISKNNSLFTSTPISNARKLQHQKNKAQIKKIKDNLQKFKSSIKKVQLQLNKQNIQNGDNGDNGTNQSQNNLSKTLYQSFNENKQIFTQSQSSSIKKNSINSKNSLLKRNSDKNISISQHKRINSNFSNQRNTISMIQNTNKVSLQSSNIKNKIDQKNKKDYIPIYQFLGLKKKKKNFAQHNKFIDQLYKKETFSLMNSREEEQIFLGQSQAHAARKLCEVLLKIDQTDKRPRSLLKNMKIKQVSKSMHNTVTQNFPKII